MKRFGIKRISKVLVSILLTGSNIAPLLSSSQASAITPGNNGKIVFSNVASLPPNLYTINPDGTGLTRLTNDSADNDYPSWSPDGTKIVFSTDIKPTDANGSSYPGIAIMNSDGSGKTIIVGNMIGTMPSWSPDGSKIAFVGRPYTSDVLQIYLVNTDGTGLDQITSFSGPSNSFEPNDIKWSPDGSKIAFGDGGAQGNIYTINSDGSGLTNITQTGSSSAPDTFPAWSPDGTKVMFASSRSNTQANYSLYQINADGTNLVQIPNTNGAYVIDWQTTHQAPDTTPPNVTGAPDSQPNGNGWYNHDVTVNWSSTDPDPSSGSPTRPAATAASTEGDHTYVSDQSCDPANNCATGSIELKIDKTAPVITYSVAPAANAGGWNNGEVVVTFSCSDPLANPSDSTSASGIDSCTQPVTVNTEGANQIVTGTATDKAGNTASTDATINIDKSAPIITAQLDHRPNAQGWNNTPVTISYMCDDNPSGSGIAMCSTPQTESVDGTYTLTGFATDNAGNTASATNTINIDQTLPTITYTVSPAPNAAGWNNTDVTVTFHCSDNLSGIQSCPQPIVVNVEGANQHVTATATDNAGNTASVTATVNLDKTPPTATNLTMNPALILFNGNATVSANAADALSGVGGGEYYIDTDPGQGNGVAMAYSNGSLSTTAHITGLSIGRHILYVRARDVAGNWSGIVSVNFIFI